MQVTLEEMFKRWSDADESRRARAFALLGRESNPAAPVDRRIRRWHEAAEELGVSVRTLRTWAKLARIRPVQLPGRKRSYGLRVSDLEKLVEVHR